MNVVLCRIRVQKLLYVEGLHRIHRFIITFLEKSTITTCPRVAKLI